eukprot:CAMPEP_0185732216 /NCGR_PEP_ID=MMETSP1171-20130828/15381_1 /TAXON_ID=374046 /ORGANISM="Helicotheca tamensis, Strain CCMP826" /LENGTH=195 /DNA_ID=CAMNT_0028401649 /DNA_START=23 /DNA_END=610 /DNA_ORIENTATION=+
MFPLPIVIWTLCYLATVASAFIAPDSRHHLLQHSTPKLDKYSPSRCKTASVNHPALSAAFTIPSNASRAPFSPWRIFATPNNEEDDENIISTASVDDNEPNIQIIRGTGEEITDELWDDIEGGAPSQWEVLKQLLGINIFTYILAAAIAIMLSLNAILGPGWLGQMMGLEGTGTFTDVSDSLPGNIDLNQPENLL